MRGRSSKSRSLFVLEMCRGMREREEAEVNKENEGEEEGEGVGSGTRCLF